MVKKRLSGMIYDEGSKASFYNYMMFKKVNLHLEKAPSKASRCYCCYSQIPKGSPRLFFREESKYKKIVKNGIKYPLKVKKCFCFKCVGMKIEEKRKELKEELKYLSKMMKKFKRVMGRKTIRQKIESSLMLEKLNEGETDKIRRFVNNDDWKKRVGWDKPII
jgi:hypothetical protein